MALRYSPFFRNDPFLADPFGLNSFFDPFFTTDSFMIMNTQNNNNNNNQQQLQQQQPNNNNNTINGNSNNNKTLNNNTNNTTENRMMSTQNKSRRNNNHGALSIFSPFIAARNLPMPDMTLDMHTSPTAYTVHASCPGIDKKDINISIEDRILTIKAERKQEKHQRSSLPNKQQAQITQDKKASPAAMEEKTGPASEPKESSSNTNDDSHMKTDDHPHSENMSMEDEGRWEYVESSYGHVQRSFTLPEDVDAQGLTAKYEDGVIKINIPRIQTKSAKRQIVQLQ